MNIIHKGYFKIIFISFCCLGFCSQLKGQESMNLSLGLGFPELLNVGLRYQWKQTQYGFSVGTSFTPDEKNITFSGDMMFHFAGISKLSTRRPWYFKTGLNYYRNEDENSIWKYLFLNARSGREINISRKVGIQLDLGAIVQLYHHEELKVNSGWNINFNIPILPSFGSAIFLRIE